MTTLKDYMRDFANEVVSDAVVITGSKEAPEVEIDDTKLEEVLDIHLNLITERIIGQ